MAEIEKISFDIEVTTPMFLSGANQNDVELRPQSIKGVLRYWYRALLGGIGITQIDKLKELESALWGKEEQGSAVPIRIKNIKFISGGKKDIASLGLGSSKPGTTYFLFSSKMNKRPYIDVGSTFTVELLSSRPDAKKWLSLASCALWCWIHLGAIGTRSRRGGGDLNIIKASYNGGATFPEIKKDFSNIHEYNRYLSQGITFCLDKVATLNGLKRSSISGQVNFTIINPNHMTIWLASKTWNNYQSAMEEIGKEFINFRRRKEPDYTNIKNFIIKSSSFDTVERAYFGLPIIFRYTSLGKSATVVGTSSERRASPLWFKFIKLKQNMYTIAIILSNAEYLPSGERLNVKSRSSIDVNTPSARIVNDFINRLKALNLSQVSF